MKLAFFLAAVALAPTKASACSGAVVPYTYPIVVKGQMLLRGFPVTNFVAWTRRLGQWQAVPVQVEEINQQGDYVLAGGLPFTRDSGTGAFNERDELAFDGASLGEEFSGKDIDAGLRKNVRQQWKLGFCKGEQRVGFLLLQSLGAPPPPKLFTPAVSFDQIKGQITTANYTYTFAPRSPVLLGEVRLKQPGGPAEGAPVISDSQFLMPLRTPFWLPNMNFADKDFSSAIESWQSGPVRTIVAVGVKYSAFLSLFKLHLFSELVFYKNRFVIPTVIQFVFEPSTFLKPGSGLVYTLRFPPGKQWQITSNLAPLPRHEPVAVSEGAGSAAATEVFTASGHGKGGSFAMQVHVDARARKQVPPPFLLKANDFHDENAAEYWPWLEDMQGDLGIFLDFSGVHKGTYAFGLDLLLSPKPDETFADYGEIRTEIGILPRR